MTMNAKLTLTKMPTKFAPKLLATAVAATLFAFSGSAIAETTPKAKPVDSLQKLINDTENQKQSAATEKAKQADDNAELASDDADDFAIQAQVNNEIAEQNKDDVESGQAVAIATPNLDDGSIKSIENKDGKIYKTTNLSNYARAVNSAVWTPNMRRNTAMTVKMQALLDWNHASPGPIDGGWGMNSTKALANFQTMKGLPSTGKMNAATWSALTKNIDPNQPVLVEYTLTKDDVTTNFAQTPSGSEAKSKMKGLYYQNIKEMLGERFHMDVRYLEKLNKGKSFTEGETITVINVGTPLKAKINRVVADKATKTLYAYNGDKLVATYPTTVGSTATPSPTGTFKIVNKVKMPWYKSTVKSGDKKEVFMLPPGPNNPVGVVWMGLSKPSYGIHGSPVPEGISRQASAGCVRLTNWDVLEVYANIENGASVELK
ncbi:L,D-transpeptidase family protein [Psychrobacter piechaudii]|uniref:Putative L,D-transpeptidase YkuD n=1 Tax=Psychrobacter piechaudii TaxID=1945521 RepID=A0A1R4GWL4_9GAMM|nr:L,D-transpeptidase family protein [Psychrobacter piechaudii]SJM72222.1 Putative L,D-transpeptidase YkuD [Psychrobacter piechaudii]